MQLENTSFYSKLEILQPHPISKNRTKGILKFMCVLELPSSSKERGNRDLKKCVKLNHRLK